MLRRQAVPLTAFMPNLAACAAASIRDGMHWRGQHALSGQLSCRQAIEQTFYVACTVALGLVRCLVTVGGIEARSSSRVMSCTRFDDTHFRQYAFLRRSAQGSNAHMRHRHSSLVRCSVTVGGHEKPAFRRDTGPAILTTERLGGDRHPAHDVAIGDKGGIGGAK